MKGERFGWQRAVGRDFVFVGLREKERARGGQQEQEGQKWATAGKTGRPTRESSGTYSRIYGPATSSAKGVTVPSRSTVGLLRQRYL